VAGDVKSEGGLRLWGKERTRRGGCCGGDVGVELVGYLQGKKLAGALRLTILSRHVSRGLKAYPGKKRPMGVKLVNRRWLRAPRAKAPDDVAVLDAQKPGDRGRDSRKQGERRNQSGGDTKVTARERRRRGGADDDLIINTLIIASNSELCRRGLGKRRRAAILSLYHDSETGQGAN